MISDQIELYLNLSLDTNLFNHRSLLKLFQFNVLGSPNIRATEVKVKTQNKKQTTRIPRIFWRPNHQKQPIPPGSLLGGVN